MYPYHFHMKISFVIPAYNEEKTIVECIKSLQEEIARSGVEAEIIVANNNSTDRTALTAEQASARVVLAEQKGVVFARQNGFEAATGEYVAQIDADNRVEPGWIDVGLREFQRDPRTVVVSGPYRFYDLPFTQELTCYAFTGIISWIVHRILPSIFGGNSLIKRSALQKIGGYDLSLVFRGEDADLANRLSKVGRVKFTLSLIVHASGRRYAKNGIINTMYSDTVDYFTVGMFGKANPSLRPDVR